MTTARQLRVGRCGNVSASSDVSALAASEGWCQMSCCNPLDRPVRMAEDMSRCTWSSDKGCLLSRNIGWSTESRRIFSNAGRRDGSSSLHLVLVAISFFVIFFAVLFFATCLAICFLLLLPQSLHLLRCQTSYASCRQMMRFQVSRVSCEIAHRGCE